MSFEPENLEEFGQAVPSQAGNRSKQLPAGTFVGREVEQARFREMLLDMVGARKGFLGGLLGGSTRTRTSQPLKNRLVLIGGPAGLGKTRLALRLREIAQKEKEFSGRLRTTRLDWQELFERDTRLNALLEGDPLPLDVILDILQTHCVRDNGGGYFDEYRTAVEETQKLSQTVQGAELLAVWEFRARALGRSLRFWSSARPLLFIIDNFQLVNSATETVFRYIMEESGSQVFFVLCGEQLPETLEELVAPARFATFRPEAFNEAELRQFYELEFTRYELERQNDRSSGNLAYRSPGLIAQLQKVTSGQPLAARLSAFLLLTGLTADELPVAPQDPVTALMETFVTGPLGPGHPDRLKLYGLAVLRRPEQGLLAALFDTEQDMLSVDEVLLRVNERYAFLFEPGRPMTLHPAILVPLRSWLVDPVRRYEEAGLAKVNERGLEYLEARLDEWGASFAGLRERVADLKWREWALDEAWQAFWRDEERGWPVALSLFVAGLAYRPAFSRQLVAVLESLNRTGILGETGQRRLELFRTIAVDPVSGQSRQYLRELRIMGQEGGFFQTGMPRFAAELSAAVNKLLPAS